YQRLFCRRVLSTAERRRSAARRKELEQRLRLRGARRRRDPGTRISTAVSRRYRERAFVDDDTALDEVGLECHARRHGRDVRIAARQLRTGGGAHARV